MPQTVNCPQCKSAVSVGDQAVGKRVQCPKCGKEFLAPGFAPSSNDDDDWLLLDHEEPRPIIPPAASPPPAAAPSPGGTSQPESPANPSTASPSAANPLAGGSSTPSSASPPASPTAAPVSSSLPELSQGDQAALSQFDFGDEDFTGSEEPLPVAGQGGDAFSNLPPVGSTAAPMPGAAQKPKTTAAAAATTAPTANDVEFESEYRVPCPICGSVLYAKAEQQGQKIKCSDCLTKVLVPPPPKKKQTPDLNIENAATFSLEQPTADERREDPFRRSAAELLEEAEQHQDEEEEPDYSTPDLKQWALKVFGVFFDPGVLVHWMILSMMAALPAILAFSLESPILIFGLFPGGLIFLALVVACGFAIMISVANNEKQVSEWPTLDPVAWLDQLWVAFAAAGLAGLPAYTLGAFAFESPMLTIAMTMFSVYALFPFFILSMMDMQSVMMPFSPEVARSASRCQEAWGGFYFSSGLLFAALFLLFMMLSTASPSAPAALVGIVATVGVIFTYFAMIGRLAYAIGQAVNDPPMKNEIDRTRPSEN